MFCHVSSASKGIQWKKVAVFFNCSWLWYLESPGPNSWHDATVICVHPDASLEHSSSQQPTWKSPIPARPSKRMRMIWLVWRLMAKHMNWGPKGGSFISKHPHVGTIPSFFDTLSNTSTSAFSRNPHALLRKQCQGPESTLATTQRNTVVNNGGI